MIKQSPPPGATIWAAIGTLIGILCGLAALTGSAPAADSGNDSTLIGPVYVFRKDVFNTSVPGFDRFPYTTVNRLHLITREMVIREQLLFQEGDRYDPELLAESERVLRRLPFIGAAAILPLDEHDGRRAVVVETQDRWSTEISLEVDRLTPQKGDATVDEEGFEVQLTEDNLLGSGKRVKLRARSEFGELRYGFQYRDPLLFRTRWNLLASYLDRRENKSWAATSFRPFYSLSTRWSLGGGSFFFSNKNSIFSENEEIATFMEESRTDQIFLGRMFHPGASNVMLLGEVSRIDRIHFDLIATADSPEPDPALLPENESGPVFAATTRWGRFRFREEKRIDQYESVEDLELGPYLALIAARLATDRPRWKGGARAGATLPLGGSTYGAAFASIESFREDEAWQETILTAEAQFFRRLSRGNTLAMRAALGRGWDLAAGTEFFLGRSAGLRGYDSNHFAGSNRFLLNMEDRLFSEYQLFTVALGGVVFFDTGAVWESGDGPSLNRLNADVGAGLRLGFTRSRSNQILRIEFARNLENGSHSWSVASGQLFSLLRPYTRFLDRTY